MLFCSTCAPLVPWLPLQGLGNHPKLRELHLDSNQLTEVRPYVMKACDTLQTV